MVKLFLCCCFVLFFEFRFLRRGLRLVLGCLQKASEENPYFRERSYFRIRTLDRFDCNRSLYFIEETLGHTITASRDGIKMIRERIDSEFTVFCNAAATTTAIKNEDVITWYKEHQLQLPMLSRLATIVFKITPSQYENERDFYLAGTYISACRARMSVEMIFCLLFISRNSRVTPPEEYIDLFEESTENIQYQTDDTESSVY